MTDKKDTLPLITDVELQTYAQDMFGSYDAEHPRNDTRVIALMNGHIVFKSKERGMKRGADGKNRPYYKTLWEPWENHIIDISVIIKKYAEEKGFSTPAHLKKADIEPILNQYLTDTRYPPLNPLKVTLKDTYDWRCDKVDALEITGSYLLTVDPTSKTVIDCDATLPYRLGLDAPELDEEPDLKSRYLNACLMLPVLTVIERAEHERGIAVQQSLVLVAAEGGEGKTSLCKAIARAIGGDDGFGDPQYYSSVTVQKLLGDNQVRDRLYVPRVGMAISEFSECDKLFEPEYAEVLKNLVDNAGQRWVDKYVSFATEHIWTDALIGTTNSDLFITDPNTRRWMVCQKKKVADHRDAVWNDDKTIHPLEHPDIMRMFVAEVLSRHIDEGLTVQEIVSDADIQRAMKMVAQNHILVEDIQSDYVSRVVSAVNDSTLPHHAVSVPDFNLIFKDVHPDFNQRNKSFQKSVMTLLAHQGIEKKLQRITVGEGLYAKSQPTDVWRLVE